MGRKSMNSVQGECSINVFFDRWQCRIETQIGVYRWLSQHISIVSQEPTLFGRSIKRNIMYGLEGTDMEPSDEEIERIAKLANAHDFIVVRVVIRCY